MIDDDSRLWYLGNHRRIIPSSDRQLGAQVYVKTVSTVRRTGEKIRRRCGKIVNNKGKDAFISMYLHSHGGRHQAPMHDKETKRVRAAGPGAVRDITNAA